MVTVAIEGVIWMVAVGFVIAFILSFAIGANDAANSLATSVGSKVLTLVQAFAIGCIFETLGAVLVGSKVSDTIRKGIFDVHLYDGKEKQLMVGQIAALTACGVWLFFATALKLPVSATHSIVGATLGYHMVVFGVTGVQYMEIIKIVVSWMASPLLSGFISVGVLLILQHSFVIKDRPLEPGLKTLPLWYALVFMINSFSIFYDGPELLQFNKIPLWGALVICFGGGFLVAIFVWFVVVPTVRKSVHETDSLLENERSTSADVSNIPSPNERTYKTFTNNADSERSKKYDSLHDSDKGSLDNSHEMNNSDMQQMEDAHDVKGRKDACKNATKNKGYEKIVRDGLSKLSNSLPGANNPEPTVKDHPHVVKLCAPLQILSAMFAAFAHGGNDVSNSISPLVALWIIFTTGSVAQNEETPLWLLFYGGVGMSVGLCVLGKRVIETVGTDLTTLTPSSGFSVELGAAATVLVASNLGIPISTTHCKVGSVVAVGCVRDRRVGAVNWKLFRNIILSWVVTVPCTIGLSAGLMALLLLAV